jgi:uncharacterized membrane protein YhdT
MGVGSIKHRKEFKLAVQRSFGVSLGFFIGWIIVYYIIFKDFRPTTSAIIWRIITCLITFVLLIPFNFGIAVLGKKEDSDN